MAAMATEARSTGVRGEEEEEEEEEEAESEAEALETSRGEERSPLPLPLLFPPLLFLGEEPMQTATSARRGGDQAVFLGSGERERERQRKAEVEVEVEVERIFFRKRTRKR